MKAKIIITLLVMYFITSCEKNYTSDFPLEVSSSQKSTPPDFSTKLSKESYELYSQEMFALAQEVVNYAEAQEIYAHFLQWDYNAWESITSLYLWDNHWNEYDTLWSTFSTYLEEWLTGGVSAEFVLWQKEILDQIETSLNNMSTNDFYEESIIYLDAVFDSVYALQGIPLAEMDQMLSSIMILKGSIAFVYENTDFTKAPWGWKKIAKCVAGTYGGYLTGGVGGLAVGIVAAGGIATGGVGIIVGVAVIGAVGGALGGSVVGDCWDN